MLRLKFRFAGDRVTLGLRASIIVFDIIALGFLLNAYYLNKNYFWTEGQGQFINCVSLAPVLFSLLWTDVSLILDSTRGPYHPGVDVAMELCAWCLVAGTMPYVILWMAWIGTYRGVQCNTLEYYCTQSRADLLLVSEIIAAAMIVLCGLLHFALFVKACRETRLVRWLKRENMLGAKEPHELVERVVVVTYGGAAAKDYDLPLPPLKL